MTALAFCFPSRIALFWADALSAPLMLGGGALGGWTAPSPAVPLVDALCCCWGCVCCCCWEDESSVWESRAGGDSMAWGIGEGAAGATWVKLRWLEARHRRGQE